MKAFALFAALLALSGCVVADVAETAVGVAMIPVKVASAAVDAATTSQSEADEKRGREIRRDEGQVGRRAREAELERCRRGAALPTGSCPAALPR